VEVEAIILYNVANPFSVSLWYSYSSLKPARCDESTLIIYCLLCSFDRRQRSDPSSQPRRTPLPVYSARNKGLNYKNWLTIRWIIAVFVQRQRPLSVWNRASQFAKNFGFRMVCSTSITITMIICRPGLINVLYQPVQWHHVGLFDSGHRGVRSWIECVTQVMSFCSIGSHLNSAKQEIRFSELEGCKMETIITFLPCL